MSWELYGVVGSVVIEGIRRDGVAWLRDPAHRKVAFHAIPLRGSFDPYDAHPPDAEQIVVDEEQFKPQREIAATF